MKKIIQIKVKKNTAHQQGLLLLRGKSESAKNEQVKRVSGVRRMRNFNHDRDLVIVEVEAKRTFEGFGMWVPVVGRHHE